jgi:LuxR family transcriptional regulator, maltose regulon positive regulatory protein
MKNQKADIKDTHYPLLATKLYVPQPLVNLVKRNHLIGRLNEGISCKLTLISAPAGFGKTSLLGEWISQSDKPVAWISLERGDSDPVQFVHYLIAALRNYYPSIGENALSVLQSRQQVSVETVVIGLIKELTDLTDELVIVFDDYHTVDTENIHDLIRTLLNNLPSHIHLVISTRVDPPLPLARLRVSNQLSELRTADLCFSSEETTTFFNNNMNLQLSSSNISILESRTEGWIAGLHLAAISMQGRENVQSFINTFAGDDRHIVDYLVEEVLSLQSEQIQNFLLHTSILSRLSESLCDFVTSQKGSQKILDDLEKANLFIVPLDDKRHWYRYHHLFAELLQQRLHQTENELVNELHSRASEWYDKNGLKTEAVNHALVANDFERAAHLIGEFIKKAWDYEFRMFEWHIKLPIEFIHKDPELCFFNAWMLYESGQYDAAEENLKIVDRLISSPPDNVLKKSHKTNVLQPRDKAALLGKTAAVRALMALFNEKIPDVVRFSESAIEYLRQSRSPWRTLATFTLGEAHRKCGKMAKASQCYGDAANESKRSGSYFVSLVSRLIIK